MDASAQQREIRLTVGGEGESGPQSSDNNTPGGHHQQQQLCGDLGCGRRGPGGRGRGQAQREAEERARHEAQVVEAVERIVLTHGVGGATTVPAAFAVRPRSLSKGSSFTASSSPPATNAMAGDVVGLKREKLVTLVTAALDPASLNDDGEDDGGGGDDHHGNNAAAPGEGSSNSDDEPTPDGATLEEGDEEDVLYGACRAARPKEEEAVGEALGEVCITVPSTMDKDLMLSQHEHERYVMNVVQRLIPVAGRVTAVPAMGFWMLENATANSTATGERLMQERVTIVSAACAVDAKVRSVVKETATWLANALGQEAVFVKINNQPYLIRMTDEQRNEGESRKEKRKLRGRRPNKNYRFFKVAPTMVYDCSHQA